MSGQADIKEKIDVTSGYGIYELLKQDHDAVKSMFKQMLESGKFDAGSYAQIEQALRMHLAGEEKLFYSRIENNPEMRTLVLEAYEAHDLGKQIMIDIDMSENLSADWLFAKVKLLNEAVDLHFKEEEDDLFKRTKNVFSVDDEAALGKLFAQEKNAIVK